MARFFTWLSLGALAVIASGASSGGSQQQLSAFERQQQIMEQLAQLQRQTQELLAQQASLAALAGVNVHNNHNNNNNNNNNQNNNAAATSESIRTVPKAHSRQSVKPKPKQQTSHHHHHHHHQAQQAPKVTESPSHSSAPPLPQQAPINWGKCPELEPSEAEKLSKAGVITKCLESTPLPSNITRESVEHHREQIAECALRAEGWFTSKGGYDYLKAEKEIKNKHLQKPLEEQVLNYHSQCKAESEEKYPFSSGAVIAQIQLYQACMDFYIADACLIEVLEPEQK